MYYVYYIVWHTITVRTITYVKSLCVVLYLQHIAYKYNTVTWCYVPKPLYINRLCCYKLWHGTSKYIVVWQANNNQWRVGQ